MSKYVKTHAKEHIHTVEIRWDSWSHSFEDGGHKVFAILTGNMSTEELNTAWKLLVNTQVPSLTGIQCSVQRVIENKNKNEIGPWRASPSHKTLMLDWCPSRFGPRAVSASRFGTSGPIHWHIWTPGVLLADVDPSRGFGPPSWNTLEWLNYTPQFDCCLNLDVGRHSTKPPRKVQRYQCIPRSTSAYLHTKCRNQHSSFYSNCPENCRTTFVDS